MSEAEVFSGDLVFVSLASLCFLGDFMGFPGVSDGKESACNEGDPGSITGLGRFPGEGNSKLLRQYSCLKNSMNRTWWDTVHGVSMIRHD